MVLDKKTIAMASGPNYAAFTTLFKDGSLRPILCGLILMVNIC